MSNNFPKGNHGAYGAKLFDPRWKDKRKSIIARDNNKCAVCETEDELQVHHRQYHFSKSRNMFKDPWEYPDNLLITLCKKCHNKGHNLYKVPVKQVN